LDGKAANARDASTRRRERRVLLFAPLGRLRKIVSSCRLPSTCRRRATREH
jgi:hypothetical protein